MLISGTPEKYKFARSDIALAGRAWTASISGLLASFESRPEKYLTLDLSNIDFITLLEWTTTVALIDHILTGTIGVSEIGLDLVGRTSVKLLSPSDYLAFKKDQDRKVFATDADFLRSDRVYQLAGFLESLDTHAVLNRPNQSASVIYPFLGTESAQLRRFYGGSDRSATVVLGLQRIGSKRDCKQFLDDVRIRHWREAMHERFRSTPLFESDEVWRVLCHELAVNIFEHANSSGFLTGRVVHPLDKEGHVRGWCKLSYARPLVSLLKRLNHGFLEICVADAGHGILKTLLPAYHAHLGHSMDSDPANVLMFAFDEFGTCKEANESWATERHALGRILRLVSKYGGALVAWSDGVELVYIGQGEPFLRRRGHPGYEPVRTKRLASTSIGFQLQLLLPLFPIVKETDSRNRRPPLESHLPRSFRPETQHVRGHLIPLLEQLDFPGEGVGRDDQNRFRKACERLTKSLFKTRPRNEPFVLDFTDLKWTAGQFETFLYLFQNLLQDRPTLLVEIDPALAREAIQLERISAPSRLTEDSVPASRSVTGTAFGEWAERQFMETYSGINCTLLGLDRDGNRYVFGLNGWRYEDVFLGLISREYSFVELCALAKVEPTFSEAQLRALLTSANPLLFLANGKWRCVWDDQSLATEASRVMSRHFDQVAERSYAWRGRLHKGDALDVAFGLDTGQEVFHLPWQDEWLKEFLESARILVRERYSDEVAQRLIYRLQHGLQLKAKQIADVKCLAAVTVPSLLLAASLHRWWPTAPAPPIVDLGYYSMLNPQSGTPAGLPTHGIVLVQDVIDTGKLSGKVVEHLQERGTEVLCVIAFVRLREGLPETRMTPISDGWRERREEQDRVSTHALLEVRRPEAIPPLQQGEDDSHAFWIEPRALRPFRYRALRREFKPGSDPELERRDAFLTKFDDPADGCLLGAGHYVFGSRHYTVAVDLHAALTGRIGEEIACWLADLCEGRPKRTHAAWDRPEAASFKGEVTAVLLPLHSQIHYLWPRVSNLLAQRGLRLVVYALDATLFLGQNSVYRIPLQFQRRITIAAQELAANPDMREASRLRILIVDDSIATGVTAETILESITRAVRKAMQKTSPKLKESPVEWIRYFAVLNQAMSRSHYVHWRSLRSVGDPAIPFILEEYAPFMGVPVHTESDCPMCRDRDRLRLLVSKCEQHGAEGARRWAEDCAHNLEPVLVDSPGFTDRSKIPLQEPIDVLAPRSKSHYMARHADTAIWRFYELMYLSYPPADILRSLEHARPRSADNNEVREYERFRLSVFRWCLRNWSRLLADSTKQCFVQSAWNEVERDTSLVQYIFEAAAAHASDTAIVSLIKQSISRLKKLERLRADPYEGNLESRSQQVLHVYTALTLFFLQARPAELRSASDDGETLLEFLGLAASELDSFGDSFLHILYRRLTQPQRYAEPGWALKVIAENLYRGRQGEAYSSNHDLLPRLVSFIFKHPDNLEYRHLLHGSLAGFLAALEDLKPFMGPALPIELAELIACGKAVLEWLALRKQHAEFLEFPPELYTLDDSLKPSGHFCTAFDSVFHQHVDQTADYLRQRAKEEDWARLLTLEVTLDPTIASWRILTQVYRLRLCLANLAIDPQKDSLVPHRSRVLIGPKRGDDNIERILFRILTNFAPLADSRIRVDQGGHARLDRSELEIFGSSVTSAIEPLERERKDGFTAAFEVVVPVGF